MNCTYNLTAIKRIWTIRSVNILQNRKKTNIFIVWQVVFEFDSCQNSQNCKNCWRYFTVQLSDAFWEWYQILKLLLTISKWLTKFAWDQKINAWETWFNSVLCVYQICQIKLIPYYLLYILKIFTIDLSYLIKHSVKFNLYYLFYYETVNWWRRELTHILYWVKNGAKWS